MSARQTEVVSQDWYAAYTCSCQERRVALHLAAHNIEYFLPVHRSLNLWKNGLRVTIEKPLFPSYVFVKIEKSARVRVLQIPGVHSIVSTGREPAALPGEEIEALRQGLHFLHAEPHPYLNVGDRARILRGPLAGMTGIVLRRKNGCRLVVSLDLIMKSFSVEIAATDLESLAPLCTLSAMTATDQRPGGLIEAKLAS
jgi:transcription antitermination factor NusG